MQRSFFLMVAGSVLILPLGAQPIQLNATMRGGGNGREGSCTVEVRVDGVADIEIRGASALLRDEGGAQPQWGRFECSSPLPPNPADFRFQPTNGRGRQTLVRDPRQGGVAVVRIEDPQSGAGDYRFNIVWSANDYPRQDGDVRRDGDRGRNRDADRDGDRFHEDRRNFDRDDWRGRLFERVREDVDHVQAETFAGGGDQYRLAQTRRELDELQGKLAAGRYDQDELEDVMRALRNVVRDNRMAPRDRDMLSDDLNRLRDFRERHESYGAR